MSRGTSSASSESRWCIPLLGKVVADDHGAMRVREMGSGVGIFDFAPSVKAQLVPQPGVTTP